MTGDAETPADPDAALRARIRSVREEAGRVLVVLDDDPTGSQSVHGVPIVTRWTPGDLDWAFAQPVRAFFVLTNTRSLAPDATTARLTAILDAVEAAGARAGVGFDVVLRGDSTLRGHHPLEADLVSARARAAGEPYDGVVLVPAYPEAGRVTRDGVHLVRRGGTETPVGETDYAHDATFGYRSSTLAGWAEEKTAGSVRAADVVPVGLGLTAERIAGILLDAPAGATVAADAVSRADLDALALGLALAQRRGRRMLVRSGPTYVAAALGLEPSEPLTAVAPVAGAVGGLIVVGSHVALTTRQLARLHARRPDLPTVELDVTRLAGAGPVGDSVEDPGAAETEIARAAAALATALAVGTAVLATSRVRRDEADAAASLAFAGAVSRALVRIVRSVVAVRPPAWVIAKGGITSSDVATEALGIARAEVLGQLFDGMVSVWADRGDGPSSGLPYVVFAGNVGDDESLADAVDRLDGR